MPRLALAVLACSALLLPAGGCYRYDARAKNLTNQPVRVSLHKGHYQREISTAVLAPGTSVGWDGAVNGPVFLRVMAGPEMLDVSLPRRAYTQLEVDMLDGELHITKTVEGESVAIEEPGEAAQCDIKSNEPDEVIEDIEVIELEEDGAEPTEEPEGEMIDLIESDEG